MCHKVCFYSSIFKFSIIRQKKQKINTFDNATEDSYSFDLTNVYNFRKDLSYPLTGDEKINILNVVLVVSFLNR